MLLVRPVQLQDHGEILGLARQAGIGMTSLPPDAHVLERKIARAVGSFAGAEEYAQDEAYLFALTDTDTGKIIGTTGIIAHVGTKRPFYSYKLSTIVQASEALNVYSMNHVLHMVNDYTGASEIGSLFLVPEYRKDGIGKFLSRCRYLMLAQFPELFSDTIISEIRGFQNIRGESPFYHHMGKYFFQMEFKDVDFIYATQGGQFIADLMPKYPIYVKLLAEEAQEVIGVPHDASHPAKKMLEEEGFSYEGYVDVFDAGPTLQVERAQIRTVKNSWQLPVKRIENIEGRNHMIAHTRRADFCMVRAAAEVTREGVVLPPEAAALLKIKIGDVVRIAE